MRRYVVVLLLSVTFFLAACRSTESRQAEQQDKEQARAMQKLLTAAAQREIDAGLTDR